MQPHQQRVIDEQRDLDERIAKLAKFVESPPFKSVPYAEQGRMSDQLEVMLIYSSILGERIADFISQ